MTWFKVDDSFHSHPKTAAVSLAAVGLWTVAGTWSGAYLTDGLVDDHMISLLSRGSTELVDELVRAGLWTRTKGGYRFHDWSDYQPTSKSVRALRETRAEAGRKGGVASGASRSNGHSKPEANASLLASGLLEPPSRPDPKEKQPPKPPKGGESDPAFDAFWAAYPRKVGKPNGLKAWRTALKRGHDPNVITAAARRYAETRRGQDAQYTAYPATWLNDQRYNDTEQPSAETGGWWTN